MREQPKSIDWREKLYMLWMIPFAFAIGIPIAMGAVLLFLVGDWKGIDDPHNGKKPL